MPTNPEPHQLAEIIALHREMFHGYQMMADSPPAGDPPPAPPAGDPPSNDPPDGGESTDWKSEARKWEARAKENKNAAARLAELEEANKTEAQKIADRATKAEQERDQLATQLATIQREQSVYRNAGNADPQRLLDSRSFLDTIQDIDPADDKAIKAAVAAALRDNPHLSRVAQSTGDAGAGHQKPPNSVGMNDLLRAASGKG